jgi:hypothetical protein
MRILFDQGTPVPLRRYLSGHSVETAYERGWSTLQNSELLLSAEREGFELLITTDQNLKYQQELKGRRIAILVLLTTSWRRLSPYASQISNLVDTLHAGDYKEFGI